MPHLRDYRIIPGLYVPRAPEGWIFIDFCALATAGSTISADADILHKVIAPLSHDYRIPPNPCFLHCHNQWFVNEIPDLLKTDFDTLANAFAIDLSYAVPSVLSHDKVGCSCSGKNNRTLNLLGFPELHDTSAHREYLRLLRFRNVRIIFRVVRYFMRVLVWLNRTLFQVVQRIVHEGRIINVESLIAIIINAKQAANDGSRPKRIKQSFMRTLMRKHDFRVYICKYKFRTRLLPWVCPLIIPFKKYFQKSNTLIRRSYHQAYVVHWIICWKIKRLRVSFQVIARVYANNVVADFLAMVRRLTDKRGFNMFQAPNVAFVSKDDQHKLFCRDPPSDFVFRVNASSDRIELIIPGVAGNFAKKKMVPKFPKRSGGGGVGYRGHMLSGALIKDHVLNNKDVHADDLYVLESYVHEDDLKAQMIELPGCIVTQVPVHTLTDCITVSELKTMGALHCVKLSSRARKEINKSQFRDHHCHACTTHFSLFTSTKTVKTPTKLTQTDTVSYPPSPADESLISEIIHGFCRDTQPEAFEEAGCGVCGQLNLLSNMKPLDKTDANLNLLVSDGFTRSTRSSDRDPVKDIDGPIIDTSCQFICTLCEEQLLNDKVPWNALSRGLWLGPIPPELSNLTFAEQMMIARIRHNRCLVRVSSGRAKMIANCIMFSNPTAELHSVLPPSREELSEVLAFVFLGSARPTEEDLQRTPMLVRRNHVAKALEWLKLNHVDYADLNISHQNLDTYPISGVPVVIDYRKTNNDEGNKIPTAMSKFDTEVEEGTTEGPCPFTVHGLTGEEYSTLSIAGLKIRALEHLDKNGISVGFRHEVQPQSMYNNPQAYPQMFPWLFPYGLGGIGQPQFKSVFSAKAHKNWLLMYHDKRFQNDLYFPMIAFNHEQLKDSTTGSFLLTKRRNFPSVAKQLLSLKPGILEAISRRMASGEYVKPVTDEEKKCFSILDNLDIIGGSVKGSITSKKRMRNEIWSLVAFKGAPSWFVTFSPADNKHPICLYYADKDIHFKHNLRSVTERDLLVLSNPVAAARFFDYMVRMVIKHVLGVGELHPGLYGKTSAYYGTVEQQGRLTLHMHMMLWIEGAISPQKIREKLMSKDSEFEEALKRYLESVHAGEFMTGSMEEVRNERSMRTGCENSEAQEIGTETKEASHMRTAGDSTSETDVVKNAAQELPKYEDPTQTMPSPPSINCSCPLKDSPDVNICRRCEGCDTWWGAFRSTVDDLLLRSNVHTCRQGRRPRTGKTTNEHKGVNTVKGCLNKDGICMARFPRDIVEETFVDHSDGHILMKKRERMLNTFSYVLTYLLRCNTDVTSLLSGTSIKAVISYVTDYITKPTLKTHQIFSSAYDVYEKNSEMIGGDKNTEETARKLLLKIVNSLTAKMEIGSPMACLYLLDNPDHYTSHEFAVCWWRNYVSEIMREGLPDENVSNSDESTNCKNENCDNENCDNSDEDENMYVGSDSEEYRMNEKHEYVPMEVDSDDDLSLIGGGINEALCDDGDVSDVETDDEGNGDDKIVLGLEDGKYVPKSYVDDYRFRPVNYEHYTLYRWIQCQRVKKRTAQRIKSFKDRVEGGEDFLNNRATKFFPFLAGHPLYMTHEATCDEFKMDSVVPNFLGGTLPRADEGDREFYCATMLTIFKPWRNAAHLKAIDQTWDDAFCGYIFPEKESELINNLNLRYECLDARDDFHAEMNKKVNVVRKMREFEDEGSDSSDSGEDDYARELDIFGLETVGKANRSRREQMDEMESILKRVGWMSEGGEEGKPPVPDMVCPEEHRTPGMWKTEVDRMRKEVGKAKRENMDANHSTNRSNTDAMNTEDKVQLIHASYFRQNFKTKKSEINSILRDVITAFRLNKDQERAFKIVANHASTINPLQLKMFLNGMAGTGKTQVIKALMEMFKRKGESHRFLVLGPTGTSAALLNGSTYHSALGIRIKTSKETGMGDGNSTTILADVTERLSGVDYIFLDEISMVACHELYAISARLSAITKVFDLPFGGMNVIFAGDFAQLPPTTGVSLYNDSVTGCLDVNMSVRQQENTIGKLLWQQVTTVVILKENMRQTKASNADKNLRTALENMRYASCTALDIAFLKSRVAGLVEGRPQLTESRFRNVSIITAYNSQKDRINAMGTTRFEAETRVELHDFYSIDLLNGKNEVSNKKRKRKGSRQRKQRYEINSLVQNQLWNAPPSTSDHIAGKLTLCKGLPIMIRNNDATELCITKGQEGVCVGWDAIVGSHGKQALETLYVELTNPPKPIQFQGLPPNVVPIPRTTTDVNCRLPNDTEINVQREQVVVLPNFAMTDYSSQGKTRPNNVVDLGHCKNHQSYYTALSRSASAAGTVLVQGFAEKKITGGISGYLRQEFRELEILNTITKRAYEGNLPDTIKGRLRNVIIKTYQKSAEYRNERDRSWHPAIQWRPDEVQLKTEVQDGFWSEQLNAKFAVSTTEKMINKKSKNYVGKDFNVDGENCNASKNVKGKQKEATIVTNLESMEYESPDNHNAVTKNVKGKEKEAKTTPHPQGKKLKGPVDFNAVKPPLGLKWDGKHYSCGYDSFFTIIYNIWKDNVSESSPCFSNCSNLMDVLCAKFVDVNQGTLTFEGARDHVRILLHSYDRHEFPMGKRGMSVTSLVDKLMGGRTFGSVRSACENCGSVNYLALKGKHVLTSNGTEGIDVGSLLGAADYQKLTCTECMSIASVSRTAYLDEIPSVIALETQARPSVQFRLSHSLGAINYRLKGLIYWGEFHFVSRIIDNNGQVWFHDGMTTGSSCEWERTLDLSSDTEWMKRAGEKVLCLCIYALSREQSNALCQ
jgi:Helitron helicase-like domain at N-terminus/PIF1-like helicase